MYRKLYIILTNNNTILNKTIKLYTRNEFNHVSISFDLDLLESYSFGRKKAYNPFVGGFIKEDYNTIFFNRSYCEIYELELSTHDYDLIYNEVKHMENNKNLYGYNLIGLFFIAMNVEYERKNRYFCSEFVASLLKRTDYKSFFDKPYLIQPKHFKNVDGMNLVYQGYIKDYNKLVISNLNFVES